MCIEDRARSPGRFFAASTLKALLARVVVDYDVRVAGAEPGVRPPNLHFASNILPDPSGRLMFRKRQQ